MNWNRLLKQKAVYWAAPTSDGYGGHTYSDPIEIVCRWESTNKRFVNAAGEEFVAEAIVFVNRSLAVGGLLYLGELADLDSASQADPQALRSACEIQQFQDVPNIRGASGARRAIL